MDEEKLARILAKGENLFALEGSKGIQCPSSFLYDLRESGNHLNEVSSKLTKHVFYTVSKDKNLVFSPLSLHIVLSLVAACFEDPIRAPILSFLKSDSVKSLTELLSPFIAKVLADGSSSGGPHLDSSNGVWVDQSWTLEQAFQELVQDAYKARLSQVDFPNKYEEVRMDVNLWIEEKTRSLIKEILPPGCLNTDTTHIFANALYFKGVWQKHFDASMTKDYEFYLLNGNSVRIPFMTSMTKQFISAYDGFKVLRLPYRRDDYLQDGRRFSMCIFLPDVKNGLSLLVDKLVSIFLPDVKDGLSMLVDKLVSEPKFIETYKAIEAVEVGKFLIPKFKISFDFEALELLKGLGLDLPRKSKIFHKSFIEVNEEETEAAAASIFTGEFTCARIRPVVKMLAFVADHPFLFFIKEDNSGVVLFTGLVLDPSAPS